MISSRQSPDWQVWPYVMQSLLLLLAPALLAASIYMILGRIITLTDGDSRSMIKRRWITKIFVAGDIISFLGQSAGKHTANPSFHLTCILLNGHRWRYSCKRENRLTSDPWRARNHWWPHSPIALLRYFYYRSGQFPLPNGTEADFTFLVPGY